MAICAAATDPEPAKSAKIPDMSVSIPIFTVFWEKLSLFCAEALLLATSATALNAIAAQWYFFDIRFILSPLDPVGNGIALLFFAQRQNPGGP
jgi:hypothetical protein